MYIKFLIGGITIMKCMSNKLMGDLSKILIKIGDKSVNTYSTIAFLYEPKVSDKLLKKSSK